ncbi:hypothetical protein D3C85_1524320 [compost metagenome]
MSGLMHSCPALAALAMAMREAAVARSALRPMITGDLPPSSRVRGTRFSAALRMTERATAVLPVNTR